MFQMETTEPAETNTKVYYKHVSGYVIATITTYNTVDRQTDRPLDVRTYIEPARRFEVSHPSMWPHKWFVMIPTITVNMAHVAQSLWLCVRVRLLFPSDFLRRMDQTKMTMVSYLRTNTLQSTLLLTVYLSFSRSSL